MTSATILSDNGVTSGSAGIKSTGGNDGVLLLQTTTAGGSATTAVTVDNAQNVLVGTSTAVGKLTVLQSAADTSAVAVVASAATRTKVFGATGSTTAGMYGILSNTGGSVLFGVENSGGGNIVSGSGAYSAYFGTNTSTPISFAVNSAEVARFDPSGNWLLGATSLGYGTTVKSLTLAASGSGSGTYTTIGYGSGGSVYTDLGESRISGGYSTNNGYLVGFRNVFSIAASTATHGKLDIYGYVANAGGDVSLTGSYFRIEAGGIITFPQYGAGSLSTNASGVISASDGRFKNKTRPVENGLDAVMQLQPTYYRWKEDCQFYTDHEEIGFIAQEVASVIPAASPEPEEAPVLDDDGKILTAKYKNFHDRAIIAVLVKAIQEQQSLIQSLTDRLTALEGAAK